MDCSSEFNFSGSLSPEASETICNIDREGRPFKRRFSMGPKRSSTPKPFPPSHKRLSASITKRKRSPREDVEEKEQPSKTDEDFSFSAYSKRLKASVSTLNLYDIARKPLRKKTAKSGVNSSKQSDSTTSFHTSEISLNNDDDSYVNITHSSIRDASCSSQNQSFVDADFFFNKHSEKSSNPTRKIKKRRASDIGIKDIFSSTKQRNQLKPKNYDVVKLTKSKSVNVKAEKATLQDVLSSKFGIIQFRQFLQSEFSEENLDFWIECQVYQHYKGSKQKRAASAIYEKYIAPRASREVNLDCETKQKTANNVLNPSPQTFEEAQSKIYKLMETDSFQRFILSPSANLEKILLKENKQNVVQSIITNGRRRLSL